VVRGVGVGAAVGPFHAQPRGEHAIELVANEDAVTHQVPALGRHAVVVVTDGRQAMLDGAVGAHVHHVGAVAQGAQLLRGGEGGAGVGRLVPDGAVVLRGVADGLVDGQPQVGRVYDQVGRAGDDAGGLDLLAQQLGELGQLVVPVPGGLRAQVLPAATDRGCQGPHRLERTGHLVDRGGLDLGVQPHPLLSGGRAGEVGVEGLFLDLQARGSDVVHAVGGQQPPGVFAEQAHLVRGGHGERVEFVVRHPGGGGVQRTVHRLVGEHHGVGVQRAQGPRHLHGPLHRRGRDRCRQFGVAGEAPGAVDDDADREADAGGFGGRLHCPVAQP